MRDELKRHLAKPIEHIDEVNLRFSLECRACGAIQPVLHDLTLSPPWKPLNGPMSHQDWCPFYESLLKAYTLR